MLESTLPEAPVYWLCDVLGEPGAETAPFASGAAVGWEDDLELGVHELPQIDLWRPD